MPKFEKGDYVVHPGQGVCSVEGVVRRPVASPGAPASTGGDAGALLYELYPASGPRMRICFPVSREGDLRCAVGAGEAKRLIAQMPQLEDDPFFDRQPRLMEEHFMLELRNGDCRDALRTLKTIRHRCDAQRARGKKPSVRYDRIYRAAHDRAMTELGVALDATPEEVDAMIEASFRRCACA